MYYSFYICQKLKIIFFLWNQDSIITITEKLYLLKNQILLIDLKWTYVILNTHSNIYRFNIIAKYIRIAHYYLCISLIFTIPYQRRYQRYTEYNVEKFAWSSCLFHTIKCLPFCIKGNNFYFCRRKTNKQKCVEEIYYKFLNYL